MAPVTASAAPDGICTATRAHFEAIELNMSVYFVEDMIGCAGEIVVNHVDRAGIHRAVVRWPGDVPGSALEVALINRAVVGYSLTGIE